MTTPATQTAGTAFAITTITAQDVNNNTVTGYVGTVDFTETGGGAGGTVAPTQSSAFVAGVRSGQSVTLTKSGAAVTITVTDHLGTKTGVSGAFTVNPGAATKIRVETASDGSGVVVPAQNVTAGNSITVFSISRDANNNFVANAAADSWSLVSITGGVLAGDLVAAGDLKSATFTGRKTGTAVIRSLKAGLAATDSGTLTVVVGPLDHFAVTTPGTQTAGTAFAITTMTAQDFGNNTVTTYVGTVDFTETGGGAGGTVAPVQSSAFVAGVRSGQSVTLTKSGAGVTITVTDHLGTKTGVSGTFTVNPGAASKLAFGTQPSDTSIGFTVTPAVTVQIQDANGNLTTSVASVTVAIGTNPSGGTLSGTKTRAAVSGTATFNDLSIDKTGVGYTLTAASGVLTGATSSAFNIIVKTYWVNNATGSDGNAGTLAAPFATIAHAVTAMGASGNTFVQVGNSQSGSPYAANVVVAAALSGTAALPSLIQGVASGTTLPLVKGTDPANDAGFDVQAN